MIAGIFHKGSGLGNQLHRYVGTRCMALDMGEEHGMVAPELFKGASFMNLDMGKPTGFDYLIEEPSGRTVVDGVGGDVTIIDAEFQGAGSFMHRLDEVRDWLKVEPLEMPDDLCVVNFRGGEYVGVRNLFLPPSYWYQAIEMMKEKHPNIRFEAHTDDPETAKQFFDFPIIKDIALNWRSIRYAKHLILSNSSFAILPALLGDAKEIIAPKFWANRNRGGEWQTPDNNYERFTYI